MKERCKRKRGEEGKWVAMNYACQESKRGRARNIDRRNAALCVCGARDIAKILATVHAQRERERILSNHVFLDDNCILRTQLYNKRRIEESDKEKLQFFEFLLVQLYIRTSERRTWFKPLYQGILLRNDS